MSERSAVKILSLQANSNRNIEAKPPARHRAALPMPSGLYEKEWMEATDPASGRVFLEHFRNGESRWKSTDAGAGGGGGVLEGNEVGAGATRVGNDGVTVGRGTGGSLFTDQKVGSRGGCRCWSFLGDSSIL